jgi:hypothetical protein
MEKERKKERKKEREREKKSQKKHKMIKKNEGREMKIKRSVVVKGKYKEIWGQFHQYFMHSFCAIWFTMILLAQGAGLKA